MLINRGIHLNDIPHYLNTSDKDILPAAAIENIEEGAKILIKHISQGDKVLIQVDSDADGYTSAATLINYLYRLFPGFVKSNIQYRIHTGKQHGVILDSVPEDVKLVIIPDAGSNQFEEHKELFERGVDVLVIDHHESEGISQYACVINNQLCDYPTKSLSGVGMVYKFCSYIDELLGKDYANDYLDLVALGLVADMMDMRDFETKHLVEKGLRELKNPYFKAMVTKNSYSIGSELTPFGVAFYVAPYVNATIRVGTQDEKLILFESMLDYRGYELIPSTKRGCKGQTETRVEQACRNCTNIKNRQTKARDASLEIIERIIEENNLLENKILAIKLDADYAVDKNLTGLVANQIMSKYQRPVLILNERTIQEEDPFSNPYEIKTWEGSGRGYDKSSFDDLRKFLLESGLVRYAEGHSNALGVGIEDRFFSEFINYSNNALKDYDFSPFYRVDFIYSGSEVKPENILDLANFKHLWGQGVEEPFIAIENVKITKDNITLMSRDRNPTLKITLPNGMSVIKFRSSESEYEELYSDLGCVTLNIVGKCERNEWNGNITPQIICENYEVVGRTDYYF